MTKQIVTEQSVEMALDWLRDNADEIGEAKRQAVKYEHMLKHAKAVAMKSHLELPVSAQEREALASDVYLEALKNASDSAGNFERLKALREAAALRIEVWRSASANYRAMKL